MHLIKVFNKVLAPKIRNSEEIRENVSKTLGQKTKQNIIFPSATLYADGLKLLKKITHQSNKHSGVLDSDKEKNEVKDEALPLLRPQEEQSVTGRHSSTNKKESRNDDDVDNHDTASESSESRKSHLSLLIDDVEGNVQINFDPDHASDTCSRTSGHDTTMMLVNEPDTEPDTDFDDSFETDDMSESDPMSQDYFLTRHSLYNERASEKMPSDTATASRTTTEDVIPSLSRSFEAPLLLVEDEDLHEKDASTTLFETESAFEGALAFFEDWNFHADDDDSDASSCSSSEDEDCLRAQAFRISQDIERVASMQSETDDDDESHFSDTSFSRASLHTIPEEGSWQLDDEEPSPKVPNQASNPEFKCEKTEAKSPFTEAIENTDQEDFHHDKDQTSEHLHEIDGIDQCISLVDSSFENDTNTFIDERIYEDDHEDDVPPSPVSVQGFDEHGVTENDIQTHRSGESGMLLGKHTEHHVIMKETKVIMKETNVIMKETTLFLEYEQRTTFEHNIASISQRKIQELDVSDRFFLKFFGLNELPPTGISEQFHRTTANTSLDSDERCILH
eukprot:CAMPEP_0198290892 /NCGR_PEP_ID=MMETSP1449-20131203/8592_1 /TAXON_ID=420275 /ORGANISM="Attheya septentrionalis, Strain CCMP2084" /LENGTH=562 /DNA_ID=CAMNT_0043989453 /DNA_START=140 /DNA_END=1828 /DNA_ORIENTATION=+